MLEILTGCQSATGESRWESFEPKEPNLEAILTRGGRYSGEIGLKRLENFGNIRIRTFIYSTYASQDRPKE